MRWLKVFWNFLQAMYQRIVTVLDGLLGPPLEAFKRVLAAILRILDGVLTAILEAWARLWQKSPETPRDRQRTPAITVLPLAAAAITLAVWYCLPIGDWLDLSTARFVSLVL